MDKLIIRGGVPLLGEVRIGGAKNSVLPILAASLLTLEPLEIENVPHLKDVTIFMELLGQMGARLTIRSGNAITVEARPVERCIAPYDLVSRMRASVLVLGPLLARFGRARVALPGGCAIGSRPVDLHVEGLQAMGADIKIENGFIEAHTKGRLCGTTFTLRFPSVTATENLLMAAVLAKGTTVLQGVAKEPEIVDLARFLRTIGAQISGEGSDTLIIEGVARLGGGTYRVLPDRIETGTYLVAAAMTRGRITARHTDPTLLSEVLAGLEKAGAQVSTTSDTITVCAQARPIQAVDLCTGPYPAFPTDLQAQFLAMNTVAQGQACIKETIFENRFMHVDELRRMGADIRIVGHEAHTRGAQLTGAPVNATDLRASASLVLAGLVAQGITEIRQIHHIDRGYECIEEKLAQLGARIRRVPERLRSDVYADII